MPALLDPDVRLFQALGDPVRLAIVRQLASMDEVCACDFTSCCGVSQPTVSHHLKVLREAGVIESERRGTWVFYRITPDAATRLESLAGLLRAAPQSAAAIMPPRTTPARQLPVLQS